MTRITLYTTSPGDAPPPSAEAIQRRYSLWDDEQAALENALDGDKDHAPHRLLRVEADIVQVEEVNFEGCPEPWVPPATPAEVGVVSLKEALEANQLRLQKELYWLVLTIAKAEQEKFHAGSAMLATDLLSEESTGQKYEAATRRLAADEALERAQDRLADFQREWKAGLAAR